jgi:hypothetical protein
MVIIKISGNMNRRRFLQTAITATAFAGACATPRRQGRVLNETELRRVAAKEELNRPSLGLFDSRARMNIGSEQLPLPVVYDGERIVKMSPERRRALRYQCHAPLASGQIGSGDDRTPMGVHEGPGCHEKHDLRRLPSAPVQLRA